MCTCGQTTPMQTMTTTEVNALLEQAREQAKNEQEAMIASAQQAAANASSSEFALR